MSAGASSAPHVAAAAAIGRRQSLRDRMDPARAAALAVLLDAEWAFADEAAPLPPFFHQAYFWEMPARRATGRDGHPARGPFIPDLGLPRRMWAGGRLTFLAPLHAGHLAEKTTEIVAIAEKAGHTGRLAFVTLRHEITQAGALRVIEEQDLVYREAHDPAAPTTRIRPAPEDSAPEPLDVDPALLFRYSALTLNGHRIHYDADYATKVEGYGGIVAHGPLLAQRMMLRAAREGGPLAAFHFSARRPLLARERAVICRDGDRLWVRNGDGGLNMEGQARWA